MATRKKDAEVLAETSKATGPPTFDDIKAVKRRLESQLSGLMAKDVKRRASLESTYKVFSLPPHVQNFEPSTIHMALQAQAVKLYKGFLREDLHYSVIPGKGPESEKKTERAEGFLNFAFSDIEEQQGAFQEDIREDVLGFGRGFLELLPDPHRWAETEPGFPDRGDNDAIEYRKAIEDWKQSIGLPVLVTFLPADEVLAVFGRGHMVLLYIQSTKLPLAEVIDRWGDKLPELKEWSDLRTSDPAEPIDIIRYGDSRWMAYAVDHNKCHRLIHDPPLAHGMGRAPLACFPGLTTSSRDLAFRYRAVFDDADEICRTIDELRTRQANAIRLYPFAQPVVQLDPEQYKDGKKPNFELDPREPMVLWINEKYGIQLPTGQNIEAEALEEKLDRHVEQHLLPAGALGNIDAATGAVAWSLKLVSDLMARTKLQPLAENLAQGGKQAALLLLAALQSHHFDDDEKFYVRPPGDKGTETYWITKAEAKEYASRTRCSLTVQGPVDRNQDIAIAIKAEELRLPLRYRLEELAHIENPAQLRDEWLLEQVTNSPEYIQLLTQEALEHADMLESAQQQATGEEIAAAWPTLSPEAQQAIMQIMAQAAMQPPGVPPAPVPTEGDMAGVGGEGWPEGAAPQSLQAGMGSIEIPGPNPNAPAPGAAMP